MKRIEYKKEKDRWLKEKRNITFKDILRAFKKKKIVDVVDHPNQKRYPNQQIYLVEIKKYIFCVPFLEDGEKITLITIFPSRKYTKKYLKEKEF